MEVLTVGKTFENYVEFENFLHQLTDASKHLPVDLKYSFLRQQKKK